MNRVAMPRFLARKRIRLVRGVGGGLWRRANAICDHKMQYYRAACNHSLAMSLASLRWCDWYLRVRAGVSDN